MLHFAFCYQHRKKGGRDSLREARGEGILPIFTFALLGLNLHDLQLFGGGLFLNLQLFCSALKYIGRCFARTEVSDFILF